MRFLSCGLRQISAPRALVGVSLFDGEGVGEGDAAPLPPFSTEDAGACARAIAAVFDQIQEVDEELPALDAVGLALAPVEASLASVPSARFALETAMLDRLAAKRGVSVAACIAGGEPVHASVPVNGLLIAPPTRTLVERALALAVRGFSSIKIKLRAVDDAGFARELSALREVRKALPSPFELRLDPNGAWTVAQARRRLAELAPIAPRYVEQPVAAHLLANLGACDVPWAADESLLDPVLVEPLLAAPGCNAFILKPSLLGGILRARSLALRAQAAGLDVVVTHLFDGPRSMAAAAELAVSLPRPPIACGLDQHGDLAEWMTSLGVTTIPQLAQACVLRSSGGPGLGIRSLCPTPV